MAAIDALAAARVVPVVEIDDPDTAIPLARALIAGGIPVLEVTLRTGAALAAVQRITDAVPELTVGVGTILFARDVELARAAGAAFLVSPGFTPAVAAAADAAAVPFIPGTATVSEVIFAIENGHTVVKFFPAEANGGIEALRAISAPLAHAGVRFMPTGGIRFETAASYLALPAVIAVGGTWVAPRQLIRERRFDEIEAAARAAVAAFAGA